MNCSTFRRHLNEAEHVLESVQLEAALQEHLATCASCQLEWRIHASMLHSLAEESVLLPSAHFTAQIMAKLPAFAPAKKQRSYETILLFVMIGAGLLATWLSSDSLRQSVFTFGANNAWLDMLREAGNQILGATLWKWQEVLTNTLGEQILKQGLQVLLIALVTCLVAKGAVALENRLRRMLR